MNFIDYEFFGIVELFGVFGVFFMVKWLLDDVSGLEKGGE